MGDSVVWGIFASKNRRTVKFPFPEPSNKIFFCEGEVGDILSFGFSLLEQDDHLLEYIAVNPVMMKRIIREVEDVRLHVDQTYLGSLWTAKIYMTDKLPDTQVFFSNFDHSVVLCLDLNNK